ncbi:hypothetical protein AJ85_11845 [Alkalihalobacillus alcalophilus ATCC 27647 = CGMCC 1.3604]|uniref:Uncharacterized protein n=1 Tax=Alkalihalobacillus alcalophilus ATCC 27647 = CGMCC 1.3604 TaxID=1218173 RepID=A0A094WJG2_ALKAL|nr:hypothetical protein [Alkalihalobacillus alcalophilus]KGA96976.1 hypothetical protein BALCAV_0212825 [Alkalihalobacillus alcalophilus ATCC 27647 = CGMCC 1.3604]THG90292.1 hypothetical protein AJ85_11845 [Alkalihalobacillus alcalophilus ATCC 27647 = CGMCC 1.3604]
MKYFIYFFALLSTIGGLAFTLSFFGVGEEIFNSYYFLFMTCLWIGIVGSLILKIRSRNNQNKSSFN